MHSAQELPRGPWIGHHVAVPKEKGARLCKNWDGLKTEVGKEIVQNMPKYNKRATKEQVERLKYNITNAVWLSKEKCDSIN